jgi:hypothetical protein
MFCSNTLKPQQPQAASVKSEILGRQACRLANGRVFAEQPPVNNPGQSRFTCLKDTSYLVTILLTADWNAELKVLQTATPTMMIDRKRELNTYLTTHYRRDWCQEFHSSHFHNSLA